MTPKVLIWSQHPGDLLGQIIVSLTHGPAQHAGFLRSDGKTIHEAYLPKVRDRLVLDAERQFIRCFEIEGMTDELAARLEDSFDKAIAASVEYSVENLFRFLFNAPMGDDQHTFCSRYVMGTMQYRLPVRCWPLLRCINDQVSPRDLLISPRLHEISLP